MDGPTYGDLVTAAENQVLAAVGFLGVGAPGPASTRAAIHGHGQLLHVAAKHADFLLSATHGANNGRDHRRAAAGFRQALTPWRQSAVHLEANAPSVHEAWRAAAVNLGLAHDVLASHVGPSGQSLTLHAQLLDDRTARSGALLRLAAIVDVAALAAPRLARQAHRAKVDSSPELALLEQHTMPLWIATAQLTGISGKHAWTARLDRLRPPPRLHLPTADPKDPLGTVNAAIDVVGRLTIEQVHQPGPHSVASLHLVNATMVALLGHAELLAQSESPDGPTELAHSLSHARTAWFHAGRAVAVYPHSLRHPSC
jgi:hypothetical protein